MRMFFFCLHVCRSRPTAGCDLQFAILLEQVIETHGERVKKTEDFAAAFRRAEDSGKPALIDLISDPGRITTRATLGEVRGADS